MKVKESLSVTIVKEQERFIMIMSMVLNMKTAPNVMDEDITIAARAMAQAIADIDKLIKTRI